MRGVSEHGLGMRLAERAPDSVPPRKSMLHGVVKGL